MGRGKHRSYPEENNEKTRALQKKIKQQDAEIKRLKSELKTLNEAFYKTATFIKDNSQGVTVEKMIEGVRKDKTLEEIRHSEKCPKCNGLVISSNIPFGVIKLCEQKCGYREVVGKKDE